jgi:pilus assembly protein CpaC
MSPFKWQMRPARTGAIALTLLMAGKCHLPASAQQAPAPAASARPAVVPARAAFERVVVTAGRSTVVTTDFAVTRVAVTNPEIADAVVVQPHEVLVDGKKPGTISLILWSAQARKQYDIVVEPAVTTLEQQLQALFPGEDIAVGVSDEAIVLSGHVSSTSIMLRAGEIATASTSKSKIINMLQVPGGSESQQVMLQVRFAEVNRRALTELGMSLFVSRARYAGRSTTQQFAAPDFDDEKPNGLVFSDFLNLMFFDKKEGIGGVLRALEQRGGFQSLAEPNLIAYNGQEASFLAGGEFPVPVLQGNSNSVTVLFKEFGIRLNFKPTIAGDVIRLKVRPEVSTLDFANGVSLQGFRIPALTTRRAETDVELRDGQSFAIAGLLDNIRQDDVAAIPILSKLPIIGALFRSKADRSQETELMVLITPRLVRALNPDEVPPLPTTIRPFIKRGDIGQQLDGSGGIVDAPAKATPATPVIRRKP